MTPSLTVPLPKSSGRHPRIEQQGKADAYIARGELAIWFDQTTGAVRARFMTENSAGTAVAGSVNLKRAATRQRASVLRDAVIWTCQDFCHAVTALPPSPAVCGASEFPVRGQPKGVASQPLTGSLLATVANRKAIGCAESAANGSRNRV